MSASGHRAKRAEWAEGTACCLLCCYLKSAPGPCNPSAGPRRTLPQYLDKVTHLTAEQLMAAMLVDLKQIAEKEQGEGVSE